MELSARSRAEASGPLASRERPDPEMSNPGQDLSASSRRRRRIAGFSGVRLNAHPKIRHAAGACPRHLPSARRRCSLAGVHVRKVADVNGRASNDGENEPYLHGNLLRPPRDDAEETAPARASMGCLRPPITASPPTLKRRQRKAGFSQRAKFNPAGARRTAPPFPTCRFPRRRSARTRRASRGIPSLPDRRAAP